ncbi:hypothetical protein DID77_02895 [Candidatus Marinamargulisbacteria bacterium SCGC AG-439-L15]|nr:hypothetical protein DID77_02895 [Candidatus Marinamargulisbacteria bacterium SCGC AG-439-L15]
MAKRRVLIQSVFLGLVYLGIFFNSIPVDALTLKLKNGFSGKVYIPEQFDFSKPSTLIIALHGIRQSAESAYEKWQPVAKAYQMILLCPQGSDYIQAYRRSPVDDRQNIRQLRNKLMSLYPIKENDVWMVGFSRGGNLAVEMGVLYPKEFSKVICLFGFYNSFFNTTFKKEQLSTLIVLFYNWKK